MKTTLATLTATLALVASMANAESIFQQMQQSIDEGRSRQGANPRAQHNLTVRMGACRRISVGILPSSEDRTNWSRYVVENIPFVSEEELLQHIEKSKNAHCGSAGREGATSQNVRALCFLTVDEIDSNHLAGNERVNRELSQQRCRATSAKDWIEFPGDGRARYEAHLRVVEENAVRNAKANATASIVRQAENTQRDLEFKDFRIGDPLQPLLQNKLYRCEQFTSELSRCGLTYTEVCEFQSYPAYLTDYYRSRGIPITGTRSCQNLVNKDNPKWATVAGVPIDPAKVYLHFLDGKLVSLSAGFPDGATSTVYEAAEKKYGAPPDPSRMVWPAKGKVLSIFRNGELVLRNEDSYKLWEKKYVAKEQADRDTEARKAKRAREADVQRRAKDF